MSIRFSVILIVALIALAQLPAIEPALFWQRDAIAHGEVWRLITGNFTHTNWPHMIMNTVALAIITFIFRAHLTAIRLTTVLLSLSLFVGICLLGSPMHNYAAYPGYCMVCSRGEPAEISPSKINWATSCWLALS
ncbi:integral membrane protein [Photobacterium aphoticum]|uniref:Integral membrane protein n=1 Tax=Photobacterium aphoticum TaxID=754436 RepID=A0A090QWA4_9GAMM|nr:integral membrane protein [Photobacterium aphoticum]